jgi:hypothetical protein
MMSRAAAEAEALAAQFGEPLALFESRQGFRPERLKPG